MAAMNVPGFQDQFWSNGPSPGAFYNFPGNPSSSRTAEKFSPAKRTLYPTTTGTSVLGVKFDGGILMAADTLGSYGSLARFREVSRLTAVGNNTVVGGSGDYADFQHLKSLLDQKVIDDACLNDGHGYTPKSIYSWLTRIMYYRRTRFDPLWNQVVVGGVHNGESFLGCVDKIGIAFEAPTIATGFGAYLAQPILRDAFEKDPSMSLEEARQVITKCLQVLFYRDARSLNKYEIAVITSDGVVIEPATSVQTNREIAPMVKGSAMAEASASSPTNSGKIALDHGKFYKYESIRIEWTKHFENHNFDEVHVVKRFFHHTHRQLRFVVAKLFDETTHLVVRADDYRWIKEELERRTKKSLPEVSHVSGVKILRSRKSFLDSESHLEFSMSLKNNNDKIRHRRRKEAKKHENMFRDSLKSKPCPRVLAFDVETYQHDKVIVLEIGYVIAKIDKPEEQEAFHYIIEENLHYSNKDYVPDNRERFEFGTSKRMSLVEAAEKFQQHIADVDFLVTHAGHNDEQYLAGCGISLEGRQIFDTQMLASALMTGGPQTYSLKRLLGDLAIKYDEDILHNAGNDAVYTLKAFLGLNKKI